MATSSPLDAREPTRLTLDEWADLDEDEEGELVDGRLVEEEMPSLLHEVAVTWVIRRLDAWAEPRGGVVVGSEFKLGMREQDRGRKPDLAMFLPGSRMPARGRAMTTHPPDVVVEVVSPRLRDVRRDRLEKRGEYARFGVRFYWILDPNLKALEIYELNTDGRYLVTLEAFGGTHAIPGCEGLTLDLDALWARLDALPADDAAEPEPEQA